MKFAEIPVGKVKVQARVREDLGDLDELTETVREKGVIQPITVDDRYNLLAGARRLAAAKAAELSTIPAVIRSSRTKLDAKEIELYENVYRKDFTWAERAKLEAEIHELRTKKDPNWTQRKTAKDLGQSAAVTNRHLQLAKALELVPALANCRTEDEAWQKLSRMRESAIMSELTKRKRTLKKVHKWADANYLLRDALEDMPTVADGIAAFAEVDPPYAIGLKEKRERTKDKHTLEGYNEISEKDYPSFLRKTAEQVHRILFDHAYCVWWFAPTHYELVKGVLRKVGFIVPEVPAIWYKGQRGQTNNPDSSLAHSYEAFFPCRKGRAVLAKRGRSNVFPFDPVPPGKKTHPTERPLDLILEIIDTFVFESGSVLVPFLGSGTTLIAAYKRELPAWGYDLVEDVKNRFLLRVEEEFSEEGGD